MISFKEFKKMEMKIGKITKVEEIPNSRTLIKLKVDIGGEVKQAVAGIKNYYQPSELEGKQFVFLTKMRKLLASGGPLPRACSIAPYASEFFLQQSKRDTALLLEYLLTIDTLLNQN